MQFGTIMGNSRGEAFLYLGGRTLLTNLARGVDISVPVRIRRGLRAFGIPLPATKPFRAGSFIGDVRQGGSCNCESVTFTPHGNGTHTESWGHLTRRRVGVLAELTDVLLYTRLISLRPNRRPNGDCVIELPQIKALLKGHPMPEAVVIRSLARTPVKPTVPKGPPAYFEAKALAWLAQKGVRHLVTDLPSLDRIDDAKLKAHRAWWGLPVGKEGPLPARRHATITELAFVPPTVKDGHYVMNLQVVGFPTDASPSRPILFSATDLGRII